ncbi:MAG: deoxyguanosinetriphosphate triphosphohydrolase [Coriobacteriales bacterium]|jgi:dGTPase|nr:deoxyguanosinetriphosphate triphosphohydrolase [Coriobacteriales bacterium]
MRTRTDREQQENQNLSAFAALSDAATRVHSEPPDEFRTAFQRDRDRIIHCKAFRRLKHKTQVFMAPEGDHYRTRLTHTLEVSQISRSIATALALNEDLTEAIAMGHDLGHTPYGHAGEEALARCLSARRGEPYDPRAPLFKHSRQSLRVVDVIERDGQGLNLTNETRDGIVHHSGSEKAATLEGRIVATADRIAYINHDIDDAMRAGIIVESDLPLSTHTVLGNSHSARITTLVSDMITHSDGTGDIGMSERVWEVMMELRAFLFEHVYRLDNARRAEEPRALEIVSALFSYYLEHPEALPERTLAIAGGSTEQAVVDHVASMTDNYATADYQRLRLAG